ncbi:MAG: hypothetical protein M8867_12345 [marine benthic group bacterium]|nr:hypothetical protein [Gemmatimonadota bacterium]
MLRVLRATRALSILVLVGWVTGCGGDDGPAAPTAPPGPDPEPSLAFEPGTVSLGESRSTLIRIRNSGTAAAGPVDLMASAVRASGGTAIPGASLSVTPARIATLNPGDERDLTVDLSLPQGLAGGSYDVGLEARAGGETLASLDVAFAVVPPTGPAVGSVEISGPAAGLEQGEVFRFTVEVRDPDGAPVVDPQVGWRVLPAGAGLVTTDGRFVAYEPGSIQVVAEAQAAADTFALTSAARAAPTGQFRTIANGSVETRYTSDHWEHGSTAYSGTWSCRNVPGGACGDALFVWDLSAGAPALVDSVIVDARVVNDIKVSADGRLGILTHEHSDDMQNGITLLDLADPIRPEVIIRFTAPDLTPGVHNVWIEGDYAYLVVDGTSPNSGLRILDISNPASPTIVASFYGGSSFLHDVYVRDGLAFLSHWDAGLIILDVGNGVKGGSPVSPREVGRIDIPGYWVHNAWYWPDAGYVFLGDEINLPGRVRVVDVRDPASPVEVASISRPGAAPHNFWVDEARGIGYFAWYEAGVQAFDVRGELLGDLERQGRFIADAGYAPGGACVTADQQCAWAPQLHDGRLYISDMNTGLWVLDPDF